MAASQVKGKRSKRNPFDSNDQCQASPEGIKEIERIECEYKKYEPSITFLQGMGKATRLEEVGSLEDMTPLFDLVRSMMPDGMDDVDVSDEGLMEAILVKPSVPSPQPSADDLFVNYYTSNGPTKNDECTDSLIKLAIQAFLSILCFVGVVVAGLPGHGDHDTPYKNCTYTGDQNQLEE